MLSTIMVDNDMAGDKCPARKTRSFLTAPLFLPNGSTRQAQFPDAGAKWTKPWHDKLRWKIAGERRQSSRTLYAGLMGSALWQTARSNVMSDETARQMLDRLDRIEATLTLLVEHRPSKTGIRPKRWQKSLATGQTIRFGNGVAPTAFMPTRKAAATASTGPG